MRFFARMELKNFALYNQRFTPVPERTIMHIARLWKRLLIFIILAIFY